VIGSDRVTEHVVRGGNAGQIISGALKIGADSQERPRRHELRAA
jgi:hypothetical protein